LHRCHFGLHRCQRLGLLNQKQTNN
jgi:hypothetical protein